MADRDDLVLGAFYWAMPANDPDREFEWEFYPQPVRYAGRAENGEPLWNCIGMEGATDWPMRWIGSRIVCERGQEDERLACGNMTGDEALALYDRK